MGGWYRWQETCIAVKFSHDSAAYLLCAVCVRTLHQACRLLSRFWRIVLDAMLRIHHAGTCMV